MNEGGRKNIPRRTLVESEEENEVNRDTETTQPVIDTVETTPETHSAPPVVLETPKATPRGSKKEKKKQEEIEKQCYETICEMKETYEIDLKLNSESKPGHYKIEKVDDFCARIMRKGDQETYIKLGVLKELKRWLEPLPDDSLPNQTIKRGIIGLLGHLRVRKGDLIDSGIGKIVNFYSKNAKEAPEIRKMSGEIVKKWKTMIIREDIDL